MNVFPLAFRVINSVAEREKLEHATRSVVHSSVKPKNSWLLIEWKKKEGWCGLRTSK
jgi:hypothetical protein